MWQVYNALACSAVMIFQRHCQINAWLSLGPAYWNTVRRERNYAKQRPNQTVPLETAAVRDMGLFTKFFDSVCWKDAQKKDETKKCLSGSGKQQGFRSFSFFF